MSNLIFSGESNKQDICSITREILGLDEADTETLTVAQIARAANIGRYKMLSVVLRADGRFKFDGTDQTDQPIGKFDLVSGQYEYGFATSHLKILGVSILDQNGDMIPLGNRGHISELPQDMKTYRKINGTPLEFAFGGNSFYLFPQSDRTTTGNSGGRVYFQRAITPYTYNATTQLSGFAPQFDYLVAYYAALPYAIRNDMREKLTIIYGEIAKAEKELAEFYATRDVSGKPHVGFRKTSYGARAGGGSLIPPVIN